MNLRHCYYYYYNDYYAQIIDVSLCVRWSTPAFANKERSMTLHFYNELMSAFSVCQKVAQKFFTEHWQQKQNGLWGRQRRRRWRAVGGKCTLKFSSCVPRTIGSAVIVGVRGDTAKMKQ